MTIRVFRGTLIISLLGHLTVFSLFSLSFGSIIPKANYPAVSFWGQILSSSDLTNRRPKQYIPDIKRVFMSNSQALSLDKVKRGASFERAGSLKPAAYLAFSTQKMDFTPYPVFVLPAVAKKESVIMFHPQLPYHFMLYFQDRQIVHIELMFKIISSGKTNSVVIKRKISSGNLEADLLSMRYISHYLYVQQGSFSHDTWQTVKIDLSAKNN